MQESTISLSGSTYEFLHYKKKQSKRNMKVKYLQDHWEEKNIRDCDCGTIEMKSMESLLIVCTKILTCMLHDYIYPTKEINNYLIYKYIYIYIRYWVGVSNIINSTFSSLVFLSFAMRMDIFSLKIELTRWVNPLKIYIAIYFSIESIYLNVWIFLTL